jgi:hypothetical protein
MTIRRSTAPQPHVPRRGIGRFAVVAILGAVALAACGGGSGSKSASSATTSPYRKPDSCKAAMTVAREASDAQSAVADNASEIDNALNDVASAMDTNDAAKRNSGQATADAKTGKDAALAATATSDQATFNTASALCLRDLGGHQLAPKCQGVIDAARALLAQGQQAVAQREQIVQLDRQTITDFQNGAIDAGNSLVDQVNTLNDQSDTALQQLDAASSRYKDRALVCLG